MCADADIFLLNSAFRGLMIALQDLDNINDMEAARL
jgi:hypothetical protein